MPKTFLKDYLQDLGRALERIRPEEFEDFVCELQGALHRGSYIFVWWLSAALGVASALINVPIREVPVARPAAAAA